MTDTLPYVNGYNKIETLFEKMKEAPVPETFTHDFIKNKLMLRSSTYRAMIPLLKKLEFLDSASKPTPIYRNWKDSSISKNVLGKCVKKAFSRLYEYSEYAHNLSDNELKEKIANALNTEQTDERVKNILGTYNVLKQHSDFSEDARSSPVPQGQEIVPTNDEDTKPDHKTKLGICYTINLNLPPSDDKAVFDAIFSSLKKHLL